MATSSSYYAEVVGARVQERADESEKEAARYLFVVESYKTSSSNEGVSLETLDINGVEGQSRVVAAAAAAPEASPPPPAYSSLFTSNPPALSLAASASDASAASKNTRTAIVEYRDFVSLEKKLQKKFAQECSVMPPLPGVFDVAYSDGDGPRFHQGIYVASSDAAFDEYLLELSLWLQFVVSIPQVETCPDLISILKRDVTKSLKARSAPQQISKVDKQVVPDSLKVSPAGKIAAKAAQESSACTKVAKKLSPKERRNARRRAMAGAAALEQSSRQGSKSVSAARVPVDHGHSALARPRAATEGAKKRVLHGTKGGAVRFLVQSCREKCVEIARSGFHDLLLRCEEPGQHIVWEFSTRRGAVVFSASNIEESEEDVAEIKFSSCARKNADFRPVRNFYVPLSYPSTCRLRWTNPSRLYSHVVHFKAEVVDHSAVLAAFAAASDIEAGVTRRRSADSSHSTAATESTNSPAPDAKLVAAKAQPPRPPKPASKLRPKSTVRQASTVEQERIEDELGRMIACNEQLGVRLGLKIKECDDLKTKLEKFMSKKETMYAANAKLREQIEVLRDEKAHLIKQIEKSKIEYALIEERENESMKELVESRAAVAAARSENKKLVEEHGKSIELIRAEAMKQTEESVKEAQTMAMMDFQSELQTLKATTARLKAEKKVLVKSIKDSRTPPPGYG